MEGGEEGKRREWREERREEEGVEGGEEGKRREWREKRKGRGGSGGKGKY